MFLTLKQEQGLKIAVERYRRKEKYTVIAGYAGTGKSTLVRCIIDALGLDEDDVCFTAFTGKAAKVLREKGNKNVKTLHKLMYKSFPNGNGTFRNIPVPFIHYKIVVVDEVSMVPKSMLQKLASYTPHLICLGDPFQLPPIISTEDNLVLHSPNIFLDEIMRQAKESEIIRLSMDIREEKAIPFFSGKEVRVVDKLDPGMCFWADQILTGTNEIRNEINTFMRNSLNRNPERPEDGDKLICLHNYWDIMDSSEETPLINGSIGYLKDSFDSFVMFPKYLSETPRIDVTIGNLEGEDGNIFKNLSLDKKMLLTGDPTLDSKSKGRLMKNKNEQHKVPLEFAYGYAITCHKSQGSEWNKVLTIEGRFPFKREEHARWLYTACTRASEKLILVRTSI